MVKHTLIMNFPFKPLLKLKFEKNKLNFTFPIDSSRVPESREYSASERETHVKSDKTKRQGKRPATYFAAFNKAGESHVRRKRHGGT